MEFIGGNSFKLPPLKAEVKNGCMLPYSTLLGKCSCYFDKLMGENNIFSRVIRKLTLRPAVYPKLDATLRRNLELIFYSDYSKLQLLTNKKWNWFEDKPSNGDRKTQTLQLYPGFGKFADYWVLDR